MGSAHRGGGTPPSEGGVPPGRWEGVGSLPTAAHRPGGTPPSEGGVPPPRWAEPNYPSVINKPAATRPDASDNSMTEATSMCHVASPDYLPLPFARPPKELDHLLDHHDHDLTPHATLTHAM